MQDTPDAFSLAFVFLRCICRIRGSCKYNPEGPRFEKDSISRGDIEKIKLQYGMAFSIDIVLFIPGPCLAAEKQGSGLKFSIENENFKPRMKFSSENENFVRGGMFFFCFFMRSSENVFLDLRALWEGFLGVDVNPIKPPSPSFP